MRPQRSKFALLIGVALTLGLLTLLLREGTSRSLGDGAAAGPSVQPSVPQARVGKSKLAQLAGRGEEATSDSVDVAGVDRTAVVDVQGANGTFATVVLKGKIQSTRTDLGLA